MRDNPLTASSVLSTGSDKLLHSSRCVDQGARCRVGSTRHDFLSTFRTLTLPLRNGTSAR